MLEKLITGPVRGEFFRNKQTIVFTVPLNDAGIQRAGHHDALHFRSETMRPERRESQGGQGHIVILFFFFILTGAWNVKLKNRIVLERSG